MEKGRKIGVRYLEGCQGLCANKSHKYTVRVQTAYYQGCKQHSIKCAHSILSRMHTVYYQICTQHTFKCAQSILSRVQTAYYQECRQHTIKCVHSILLSVHTFSSSKQYTSMDNKTQRFSSAAVTPLSPSFPPSLFSPSLSTLPVAAVKGEAGTRDKESPFLFSPSSQQCKTNPEQIHTLLPPFINVKAPICSHFASLLVNVQFKSKC